MEWEDILVFYKDGSSNQEQYVKALATLWERWMRGWALPDFAGALNAVGSGGLATWLVKLIGTIPQRIGQMKGFYEGLWQGANPEWRPSPVAPAARTVAAGTDTQRVLVAILMMLDELRVILKEEREAPLE